jgi:hypothetical protein
MTDTALTGNELEGALELYVRNKMAIEELQEQQDKIKAYFKQDNPEYGKKVFGRFYVQTTANKRVDDKLAREVLGEDYDKLTKESIDSTRAKRVLAPDVYEQIQKTFDPKIEIGIV